MLSVDGPVKQRLDTLAGELAKAADKELQVRLRIRLLVGGGRSDYLVIFASRCDSPASVGLKANAMTAVPLVHRWSWTRWCLSAASCVRCPARRPRGSTRLSRPSPSKCPSLAPASVTPSWRELPRTSTELWSKTGRAAAPH